MTTPKRNHRDFTVPRTHVPETRYIAYKRSLRFGAALKLLPTTYIVEEDEHGVKTLRYTFAAGIDHPVPSFPGDFWDGDGMTQPEARNVDWKAFFPGHIGSEPTEEQELPYTVDPEFWEFGGTSALAIYAPGSMYSYDVPLSDLTHVIGLTTDPPYGYMYEFWIRWTDPTTGVKYDHQFHSPYNNHQLFDAERYQSKFYIRWEVLYTTWRYHYHMFQRIKTPESNMIPNVTAMLVLGGAMLLSGIPITGYSAGRRPR